MHEIHFVHHAAPIEKRTAVVTVVTTVVTMVVTVVTAVVVAAKRTVETVVRGDRGGLTVVTVIKWRQTVTRRQRQW
jgi:hypothetical protein